MYLRAAHAELNIPALRQFIKNNPFGILVTSLAESESKFPKIQSTHIPFLFDVADDDSETELGRLRGHMARANPHSKAIIEACTAATSTRLTDEVMVLFNGPIHHYVTPKFYVETKPATGKVVPTWNYAAVQAYGTATIYFDSHAPETGAYLQTQIEDLSKLCEVEVMGHSGQQGRPGPWMVGDAPESYVNLLKKAIIGVEIEVTRLEGKFKMSQELAQGDRDGVVQGFMGFGNELGEKMASTVRWREEVKEKEKEKDREKAEK